MHTALINGGLWKSSGGNKDTSVQPVTYQLFQTVMASHLDVSCSQ